MAVAAAAKKVPAARTPAKPQAAPGAAGPPSPPPSRRRGFTPLTPMRVQAAKSMTKLADSMRDSHPDMTAHQHVRDAARMLRAGHEEAAQRHLRAAMFAMTPQSLMRNGIHTDDAHQAARQAMHGVHRHLLLVKDIADVGEKNRAAIARLGGEDDTAPRPAADPNNGYGPGALAQKPTARQPPGNQALNAPAKADGGGSDPAAADPVGPQPKGSKQFANWNEVCAVIETAVPSYGWNDLAGIIEFSAQTAALESTPAPYGKPGGPGLYGVAGNKHSDYMEQVVQALMRRGMDKGKASAIARSSLEKWAAGGGKVHPEVRAAAQKALGQEAAAAARAHGHAASWDDVARDIRLSTVLEFFNPAQPRLPVGPGGGQFAAGGGAPAASGQQQAAGKQPPAQQPPKQTPQQKAAAAAAAKASAAHAAHVAHVAHVNGVSTQKANLLVTAQDDRQKAAGLIKQRNVLLKALQSAAGKTSSGQAGAKTSTTAKTKTTAPKAAGTTSAKAPAASAKASTTSTSAPKKSTASTAKTSTAKTGTSTAAAPKAGNTAAIKAQIGQLNTQINQLLAQANQAQTQAATMK